MFKRKVVLGFCQTWGKNSPEDLRDLWKITSDAIKQHNDCQSLLLKYNLVSHFISWLSKPKYTFLSEYFIFCMRGSLSYLNGLTDCHDILLKKYLYLEGTQVTDLFLRKSVINK